MQKKKLSIDQQITFLYTSDLQKTAMFYEDVMGLDLALDQGSCRIYHAAPHSFLGICHKQDIVIDPSNVIFTFVTQDVDDWYILLKSNGVTFDTPPTYNPDYQIYHCFLRDPNGYRIEIQRFEDPRWV
jgi:catechol 2,3-dioxygenase-like lactoylglutathione lyase family enzyme